MFCPISLNQFLCQFSKSLKSRGRSPAGSCSISPLAALFPDGEADLQVLGKPFPNLGCPWAEALEKSDYMQLHCTSVEIKRIQAKCHWNLGRRWKIINTPIEIWPGHIVFCLSACLHFFEMFLNTPSVWKENFKTMMKKSVSDHVYWF